MIKKVEPTAFVLYYGNRRIIFPVKKLVGFSAGITDEKQDDGTTKQINTLDFTLEYTEISSDIGDDLTLLSDELGWEPEYWVIDTEETKMVLCLRPIKIATHYPAADTLFGDDGHPGPNGHPGPGSGGSDAEVA